MLVALGLAATNTGRDRRGLRVDAMRKFVTQFGSSGASVPVSRERLVFTTPDGTWVHPDRFSQLFDGVVGRR